LLDIAVEASRLTTRRGLRGQNTGIWTVIWH